MATGDQRETVLARPAALRQRQRDGRRSPHKPPLVLLALGRLNATGASALPWTEAEAKLADLIAEFGPASKTGRAQSATYPFTRLRADCVWVLDYDVPMENVGPLAANHVVGRFEPLLERQLARDPVLVASAVRALAESHFPPTVAPDVLAAVGFDPETVLGAADVLPDPSRAAPRRRDAAWRDAVIQAWDRQCAFCGYDGQVRGATVGVDAAHVRWFAFDGPDTLDNGLAACSLYHVLFDRGVLGIDQTGQIHVSAAYSARTDAGRALYDLHGRRMRARPGTPMPAAEHVSWHRSQVFKDDPLAA